MHRLTVLALTLLLVIASVLPTVLAREINADRLRRGYPPFPPNRREASRRDTAKRSGPSAVSTPQTVSGVVEVRDKAGSHRLGFVSSQIGNDYGIPVVGVLDPNDLASHRLPVNFSLGDYNLRPVFTKPFPSIPSPCMGPGPDPSPLEIIQCPPRGPWSFDPKTSEFTITFPGSKGDTVPAFFLWSQYSNELVVVTASTDDIPASPVRLYLFNPDK